MDFEYPHVDYLRNLTRKFTVKAAFSGFRIKNLEDKLIFGQIFHFSGFRFRLKSAWILKEIRRNLANKILEDFVIKPRETDGL